MGDQISLSRLILPALISGTGLLATQIWYQKGASKAQLRRDADQALAVLESKFDVIERRPAARIIWEPIREGDNLYVGEAVRTGSRASGRISFVKSGITFGLEPDSLVIIEEQAGALQLNLVNGGVFVKNEAQSAKSLAKSLQPIIKAGNKKIELNQAKSSALNLSVSETGAANISVTQGDVKLADPTGKSLKISEGDTKSLSTNNQLEIIEAKSPLPGASIPLSGTDDRLQVSWSRAPINSFVFIEMGSTRENLRRVGASVAAESLKISAPLPSGYFFWQLVAERGGKIIGRSPVIFNQSVVLENPRLITNANGERISMISARQATPVLLSWSRPAGSESVTVVISKDPRLITPVQTKTFSSETDVSIDVSDPGQYYWNVTAVWPGIKSKIGSKIGSFFLIAADSKPIEIPLAKLYLADKSIMEGPIELSSTPKKYSFDVVGVPETTKKIRHKFQKMEAQGEIPWVTSDEKNSVSVLIPTPGTYTLKFEALDANENTVGQSDSITLRFNSVELLPAPALITDSASIQASGDGKAAIKWRQVQGAVKYLIQISGPKINFKKEVAGLSLNLSGLLPGTHQLTIISVDNKGRPGKPGKPVLIEVPNISSIKAPTVKGLKVR